MKPEKTPRLPAPADEVSTLIETLLQTGQRLEELTSGEVDTVADRNGRTFMLRHAQDQLRHTEAAKQAAIINALPAHIALLDSHGVIVSVNDSWRQFVRANVIHAPGYAVGLNYLEICDGARGAGAADAYKAVEGVRSVLSGRARSFSLEYPCHSPTAPCWFLMTVTPLAEDPPNGVVIMHLDVTAERQVRDNLRSSESQFRQIAENIRAVFFLVDKETNRMIYISPAYEEIWGRSCESAYTNPETLGEAVHPDDRLAAFERFKAGMATGSFEYEYRIVRPDGSIRWIETRGFPIRDDAGKIVRVTGVAEDITARKGAEVRIAYLNRVYAMLSAINTLIVRVRDRETLFKEACRIALEEGGFRMCLINIVDRKTMKAVPVASAGVNEDLLASIKTRFSADDDTPLGNTMTAKAIRDKIAIISNDSLNDPNILFGSKHAESGVRSIAILPLVVADESVGVLVLYAGEAEFFHEDEMKLLKELAGDISFAIDHIEKQERLDYLAYYDVLTGLANRSLFHNRLSNSLHARGTEQRLIAAVLLDLERFRQVNETLGRNSGDELLRDVGSRLLRANDTAARIGVDMYGLILRGSRTAAEVNRALEAIVSECFAEPFQLGSEELRVACRAGVALYPDDGTDADALLRNAEAALRRSKRSGERIVFYASEMNAQVAETLAIETSLRRAIQRREFVLHYQPKVDLASCHVTGLEALIRWQSPDKGLIEPGRFIPVLEETGMIVEVGCWVVEQTFADARAWTAQGLNVPRIAVNVSAVQLQRKDFVEGMIAEIQRGGGHPEWLELEITESVVMRNVEESTRKLTILRDLGVTVAIDDFGTGYSSLSYLGSLPLDSLKIDRSFVSGMTGGGETASIASTIIALAHSLKLKVVAEGVETNEQGEMLRKLGCDQAQGFLYSQPLAAAAVVALLRKGGPLP